MRVETEEDRKAYLPFKMGKDVVTSKNTSSMNRMGSGLEMALITGIVEADHLGSGSFDDY